jgi:hypothetical protein
VFTRAYAALPPHVRCLPSRQQSPEIMRLAAKVCTQVSLSEIDDDNERRLIATLAHLARHPTELEACIAAMHADCAADDFVAARLDPLQRRGWCPLAQEVRYPKVSAWQRLSDLVADLRIGTEDLDDEALAIAFRDNIRKLPSSYIVPRNLEADAKACDMMPVTAAACYLLVFERGVRELEQGLEQRDRCIRNLENRIYELEAQSRELRA